MQTCTETREIPGMPPPEAGASAIRFDLGERTSSDGRVILADTDSNHRGAAGRRSPEQIQADLEEQYKADLEKLNRRYATKIGGAAARVRPVSERRKDALVKLDHLRAIVRRTSPVMDEDGIDELIMESVAKAYGDLADSVMAGGEND